MELEIRYQLERAEEIAQRYMQTLSAHCEQIEIVGSIRRRKPEVKDIEFVCIPKEEVCMLDMFTEGMRRNSDFVRAINQLQKVKGTAEGKYTQRELPEGIKLDLFMCGFENYGVIKLIRTGSAEYSKRMAEEIKPLHYFEGGYLRSGTRKENNIIACRSEEEFYSITGQKYIEPEFRLY